MKRFATIKFVWLGLLVLPAFHLGCGGGDEKDLGPTGEVEGTVTLDGQPLTEGSVAFYQESSGQTGGAQLGAEGKFKFATPIPVGEYQVSFQPPPLEAPDDPEAAKLASAPSTIPEGYHLGSTSKIKADVKEGPNTFSFELKKRGP